MALAIAGALGTLHLLAELQLPFQLPDQSGLSIDALTRGVQIFEARANDLKFRLRGTRPAHPDVVVVAIDEKSARRFGLYPWSRAITAKAITRLHEAGAAAIGLDITFPDEGTDRSTQTYLEVLKKLDDLALPPADPDGRLASFRRDLVDRAADSPDRALARAFEQAPEVIQGVIGYSAQDLAEFPVEKRTEQVGLLAPRVSTSLAGPAPMSTFPIPEGRSVLHPFYSAQTPLPLFAPPAARFATLNTLNDRDGTLRRSPLMFQLESPRGLLPVLALATAATYLKASPEPVYDSNEGRVRGVRLRAASGTRLAPFHGHFPYLLLNYPGPKKVFTTVSIADVIDGQLDPGVLRGKAVLVGSTLVGNAGDQRVTPFSESDPGVYTHAALISNILDGDFLIRPDLAAGLEALALLVLSLMLSLVLPRLRSFGLKGLLLLGLVAAWVVVDLSLFARGIQVATVVPILTLLAVSFALVFLGYLSVDREKLALRATFSRYLGSDVMEEALRHPEKLNQGEKREMTVLFSDIRGFTTLSERMLPEKLARFIKDYLTPMTQIVFEEKGTLDKYIGDALMAFWNAPLDQSDHALRACRAAVAFFVKLEELKTRWRAEGFPEFDIGVGINSGPMIVGNMGSDVRVDYTVMGDAVNLASRLEGTNKEYETRILISENTYEYVRGQVVARKLGAVRVKGKRKPVWIYELRGIGQPEGLEAEVLAEFDCGLERYAARSFDEALQCFEKVLVQWPHDGPASRYVEEIGRLRASPPPPGWDGVYTATTK